MADDSRLPILLVAGLVIFILQTAAYLILVEKIGQIGAIAIPWSILILYIIWNRDSLKSNFAVEEEE